MHPKKWFLSKKPWLRGGMIGVSVCFMLGLLNMFVYFPLVTRVTGGMIPNWALIPPIITGHAFPILSHFIVPYGWMCRFSESTCIQWSVENSPGALPWTMDGTAGFCLKQISTPPASCADLSELLGFLGLSAFLFILYFTGGAIVGLLMQKRKAK